MNINVSPKEQHVFDAWFLAFVVHTVQVGIGITGFQRTIYKEAGHDAWVSVLASGVVSYGVCWVMIQTLKRYPSADLYGIHQDVFGKWIGNGLSLVYMVYLLSVGLVILRNYIEIVQAWMFPDLNTGVIAFILLLLICYGMNGGIRTLVGVSFLTVLLTFWQVFLVFFNLRYAHWSNLLPLMEGKLSEWAMGTMKMSLSMIGFEILYFVYPFVKEKQKALKYVGMGVLGTTLLYLVIMVTSIVFFSEGQLMKSVWATFTLIKMAQFPFLERFEYVTISLWMFVILPNLLFYLWALNRGWKRLFGWKGKIPLYVISGILFLVSLFLQKRVDINTVSEWEGNLSLGVVFVYPVILHMGMMIQQYLRKRRGKPK